jgi:hypothetical protein
MEVQNPGSSGGLSTVTTNASLTGAGTVASPLGVKGWPIQGFVSYTGSANVFSLTANQLGLWIYSIPYEWTASNIAIDITTADGANNSDVGLYNSAGTLIANAGAQHMGSTGNIAFPFVQGTLTEPAGLYGFAVTSAASNLKFAGLFAAFVLYGLGNLATSTGGALNSSITFPALAPNIGAPAWAIY